MLGDDNNRNAFTAVLFFRPDHADLITCCSCTALNTFAILRNETQLLSRLFVWAAVVFPRRFSDLSCLLSTKNSCQ